MLWGDLTNRYGAYAAEVIREALTLEDFEKHEIEELVPFFELKAERTYEEYRSRLAAPVPAESPVANAADYLAILHRRWQEAEEMAHFVMEAERAFRDGEAQPLVAS